MTPFHRAREEAQQLRDALFKGAASTGIRSDILINVVAAEDAEDFEISPAHPSDSTLGGADAVLIRAFRQIVVRNDVSAAERAFLIAHEFGHWKLHREGHESCHEVVHSVLSPAEGDTFGTQKIEAYGARERTELQANLFARELLLPRGLARRLFLEGKGALAIHHELDLPLELVRQQLLDGLLVPDSPVGNAVPPPPIIPTKEQTRAAYSTARTSLVVAGPGTGKTATLLMRVQHLVSQGVKPSQMLLLTFSNRAARDLVDRLEELGVPDAHDIWVGTFHAFGLEFLRKNHEQFGLHPGFGVADKMAQIAVLEPHIYGLNLAVFDPLGDPLDWLNEVVQSIQRAKDELADAEAFARAMDKSAAHTTADVLLKQQDTSILYRCYEDRMRATNSLVDMGDLVMLPAIALRDNYDRFVASVGRFRHLLVDEYQDVNRASAALVKALAVHADSLWVVGDARQAIYRFRGASMRNIVGFADDYPDFAKFPLNENRRSYEEIVRVFEHTGRGGNPLQLLLPLDDVAPARGASGVRPLQVQCANDAIVRGEIAANVRRLHALGVPYREQAVLASTHDTCGMAAAALHDAGIPVLHLGDIFQRPEIKDLLSLLQLFVDRSGSGLLRVAHLPGLEVPTADVALLLAWLKIHRPEPLSWLDAPLDALSSEGRAGVQRWAVALHGLRSVDSPWEVICSLLLDRTSILRPYLSGETIADVTCRLALWQFIYYLRVPDGSRVYQTVGSFITRLRRRLRIGDDRELRVPPPEANGIDAVAVMTIHQSKGLEFEAVHLVDIDAWHFRTAPDSELIPSSLLTSIVPRNDFEALTEASNKLYVALSRAKRHLVLYEKKDRYNAACVQAVTQASHLLEKVQGRAVLPIAPPPPLASDTKEPPTTVELDGFLSYHICPRRYYYTFVRELSPSAGLHPAALVEGAVMRELFAPYGEDPGTPPAEVDRALAMLGHEFDESRTHLKHYADQLLTAGRQWLGVPRAAMAKPITITLAGLPVRICAHRIISSDSVVSVQFVRIDPSGLYARQHKTIKWVLKQLADAYPKYSFTGQLFILSTGQSESISPSSYARNDFFTAVAKDLAARDFKAKPSAWECPRCRHFMYCPA